MDKYERAKAQAIRDFEVSYFEQLFEESEGNVVRASKLSGIEMDHLIDRSKVFGVKWPRRPTRNLTPRAIADIERRIREGEPVKSIARRHRIGRGRVYSIAKRMRAEA